MIFVLRFVIAIWKECVRHGGGELLKNQNRKGTPNTSVQWIRYVCMYVCMISVIHVHLHSLFCPYTTVLTLTSTFCVARICVREYFRSYRRFINSDGVSFRRTLYLLLFVIVLVFFPSFGCLLT